MPQQNSLLRITSPASCPQLGLSICPGKVDPWAYSGPCARNLGEDVETVRQWGAAHIVTLLEPDELEYLQVTGLGEEVRKAGMAWHHWPVMDGSALRTRHGARADPWREECALLLRALERGEKIFIHCRGGLGRTGTLAARLLMGRGLEPEAAIREVRAARPGAIETEEQEDYLRHKAWLGR
ncbi:MULTISPECIES: cyclin-dependent kinase inhibitor 3 family protein [unclassified Desulfovibrio]|uniref:cyclin-dependent kinase inhibitor 3 family protein n=1 Tax=unclassified Desulfovibrio TaxID=2593640 RepID=UPI0013EAEA2C|nr:MULTISPECIES: cyclin-dependent kinase inhibitor 3 family protein [unclassified Desulfovibrio]